MEIRKHFPAITLLISADSAPPKREYAGTWVWNTAMRYPESKRPPNSRLVFDTEDRRVFSVVNFHRKHLHLDYWVASPQYENLWGWNLDDQFRQLRWTNSLSKDSLKMTRRRNLLYHHHRFHLDRHCPRPPRPPRARPLYPISRIYDLLASLIM